MRQEERRQQTTQLLLLTTKELIEEKGCEAITMKDLMGKSGLSKGAIFHYVNSKDEIFSWVLQERLEEINNSFKQEVEREGSKLEGPMQKIVDSFSVLGDRQDITNKVLLYLLGKEGQPTVAEVLDRFYQQSIHLSKEWIVTGQRHGVIPASLDADKTADLFVLLSLGFRVRSSIPTAQAIFRTEDFSSFISDYFNFKKGSASR